LIHFSDAVFTADKERTKNICKVISKYCTNALFSIDTRIDTLDEDLIACLSNAGFIYYRFGIESIDNSYKKIENAINQLENLSCLIRRISPRAVLHGYWITGFPGTTQMSINKNTVEIVRLIESGVLDIVSNKIFVPYPGTPLYQNPTKYGLLNLDFDWSKYDRFSYPVYDLKDMTSREIYEGFIFQEKELIEAYLRKHKSIKPSEKSMDYKFHAYAK
jgi:radical SAM superfamily enzyme YgiQ (UPF0313 family)